MTNRALILAALSDGPTIISRPLVARDTQLMADALRALGCLIEESPDAWRVEPAPFGQPRPAATGRRAVGIDVGNAGTVLRFIPALAALTEADVTFSGDERASQRPVGPLLAALRDLGAEVSGEGAVPFTVHGTGAVAGGEIRIDASASSQLVSGLLLAAARFGAGALIRHCGPPVPSAPHVEMTVRMLRASGVDVRASAHRRRARPVQCGPVPGGGACDRR